MAPKVSIVNHNPVIAMRKYIYPIVIFSKYDFVLKENKDNKQKRIVNFPSTSMTLFCHFVG